MFKNLILFLLLILSNTIVLYVVISHFFISKKTNNGCSKIGKSYKLSINESGFNPQKITVKVCDEIIFVNTGKKYHQPTFGEHPDHFDYPGFSEQPLAKGQQNHLIMSASGTYQIHDHFNEDFSGTIIISK